MAPPSIFDIYAWICPFRSAGGVLCLWLRPCWFGCLEREHDASRWETLKRTFSLSVTQVKPAECQTSSSWCWRTPIIEQKWIFIWRKSLEPVSKSCDTESFRVTAGLFSLSQLIFCKFTVSLRLHQTWTQSMSNTNIPAGVHNPSIDPLSVWKWCSAQLTALYVLRLLWCVSSHRSMSPEPRRDSFCKRLQTFCALLVRGRQIV